MLGGGLTQMRNGFYGMLLTFSALQRVSSLLPFKRLGEAGKGHTPLVLFLRRQRQVDLWVLGQSELYRETLFQEANSNNKIKRMGFRTQNGFIFLSGPFFLWLFEFLPFLLINICIVCKGKGNHQLTELYRDLNLTVLVTRKVWSWAWKRDRFLS